MPLPAQASKEAIWSSNWQVFWTPLGIYMDLFSHFRWYLLTKTFYTCDGICVAAFCAWSMNSFNFHTLIIYDWNRLRYDFPSTEAGENLWLFHWGCSVGGTSVLTRHSFRACLMLLSAAACSLERRGAPWAKTLVLLIKKICMLHWNIIVMKPTANVEGVQFDLSLTLYTVQSLPQSN